METMYFYIWILGWIITIGVGLESIGFDGFWKGLLFAFLALFVWPLLLGVLLGSKK